MKEMDQVQCPKVRMAIQFPRSKPNYLRWRGQEKNLLRAPEGCLQTEGIDIKMANETQCKQL